MNLKQNLIITYSNQKARELKNLVMIRTNPSFLDNLMFLETINK